MLLMTPLKPSVLKNSVLQLHVPLVDKKAVLQDSQSFRSAQLCPLPSKASRHLIDLKTVKTKAERMKCQIKLKHS